MDVQIIVSNCTCFGSTYTKIGTIQRRLAWPLRKDDTQNREAFHIFSRPHTSKVLCHGFKVLVYSTVFNIFKIMVNNSGTFSSDRPAIAIGGEIVKCGGGCVIQQGKGGTEMIRYKCIFILYSAPSII